MVPEIGTVEVCIEPGEPVRVHEHLSSFQPVPEPVGFCFGDAVVHPSGWYVMGELVVKNSLKRRENLAYVSVEQTK